MGNDFARRWFVHLDSPNFSGKRFKSRPTAFRREALFRETLGLTRFFQVFEASEVRVFCGGPHDGPRG